VPRTGVLLHDLQDRPAFVGDERVLRELTSDQLHRLFDLTEALLAESLSLSV
jgi:hypothetical protein